MIFNFESKTILTFKYVKSEFLKMITVAVLTIFICIMLSYGRQFLFPGGKIDGSSVTPGATITTTTAVEWLSIAGVFVFVSVLVFLSQFLAFCSAIFDKEKGLNPSVTVLLSDNSLKSQIDKLFGRSQIFKNTHRNWPEIQSAVVLFSVVLVGICLCHLLWLFKYLILFESVTYFDFAKNLLTSFGFQSYAKPVVAIMSVYLGIYVFIKKDYGDKWKYCNDLYYKINSVPDKIKFRMKAALAIDLFYLDLWAKRGLCKFFKETLIESIKRRTEWSPAAIENKIERLENGSLTSNEIEEILEYGLNLD